jgi:hypothetical protein
MLFAGLPDTTLDVIGVRGAVGQLSPTSRLSSLARTAERLAGTKFYSSFSVVRTETWVLQVLQSG